VAKKPSYLLNGGFNMEEGLSSLSNPLTACRASAAISASYTHIDEATKRTALSAMPDVLQ
jgi:hypothetical protein